MNIADFSFSTRQIFPTFFETTLKAPNGNRFGVIYRSVQPAPESAIFEGFKQNKQAFFIEIESEVVQPKQRGRKPKLKLLTNGA